MRRGAETLAFCGVVSICIERDGDDETHWLCVRLRSLARLKLTAVSIWAHRLAARDALALSACNKSRNTAWERGQSPVGDWPDP